MTQFGRPSVDTLIGAFKDDGDGTIDIFQAIDEVTFNDADYVKSEKNPSASPYVTKLSTIEDPESSSGHTVRFRYRKNAAGGTQIDLTVELREGYVNEGTPGTLIADSGLLANITETFTAGNFTLSGVEADSITDYTDLYLRFLTNSP